MGETFCTCHYDEEGHEFFCPMAGNNQPGAVVTGTIYWNAFTGILSVETAQVTLDEYGIHGTMNIEGEIVPVTRLNARLCYSFDGPDTMCWVSAKSLYTYHREEETTR